MKTIFKFSLLALGFSFFTACETDETAIPKTTITLSNQDFQESVDNTVLDINGWMNYNETGSMKWKEQVFSGNGYAEFSSYASGDALNVGWLISPELDLEAGENVGVVFKVAQHHLDVDSPNNSLTILISTDFDGTNVLDATWTPLNANLPTKSEEWYKFLATNIDLSSFNGKAHIAFKFKGSGSDTTLDGAFQVDDFIFYKRNN